MKSLFLSLATVALALSPAQAAQQCLVIGDSLTKEYEVEFPILYPQNRDAWDSRNWIEILHEERKDWFDMGSFSAYADVRITGHKHNWAFPGATTTEIRSAVSSSAFYHKLWQSELKSQIKSQAERVVIFAGGNDVDDWYGKVYNGTSSTSYINKTRDNLIWIVDFVRAQRSSIPIVLVAVPHLGCVPDIQKSWPTNVTKTARVTAALDNLNKQLAALAKTRGVAFASGVYDFTKQMISQPFVIGGVTINKGADANARPQYAFSGDGFHPNTSTQSRIAQIILDTYLARWPSPAIPQMKDAEVLSDVLHLSP